MCLHLLHWAPDAPSLPEYGTPLDHGECFSIKLLHSIFPELKEHFVFDLFPRRHAMWKSNGKKYTNDEIYGQDPDRQFYKKLAKARERLEREDKDYLEQHGPEALAQRQADRATRTEYQRDYKERKRAEGFILKKSKWVKKSESETDT